MNIKFIFLIPFLLFFSSCSFVRNAEKDHNDHQYKVLEIIAHKQFYEIYLKQRNEKLMVLSKRTNFIGNNFIKAGEKYSFILSRLYYYNRPSYIIVDNDTIQVMPNLGIFNKTEYIYYCNERLKIQGGINIFESENLNGLYIK